MVSKNIECLLKNKCLMEKNILGIKWDKFEDDFIFDYNEIRERLDN